MMSRTGVCRPPPVSLQMEAAPPSDRDLPDQRVTGRTAFHQNVGVDKCGDVRLCRRCVSLPASCTL